GVVGSCRGIQKLPGRLVELRRGWLPLRLLAERGLEQDEREDRSSVLHVDEASVVVAGCIRPVKTRVLDGDDSRQARGPAQRVDRQARGRHLAVDALEWEARPAQ